MIYDYIVIGSGFGGMDAHETFETVHVGVNLEGSEKESDPYFNGLGPLRRRCQPYGQVLVLSPRLSSLL